MFNKTTLSLIGNTPLVKLDIDTKATIYAKFEFLNPGGSIKDRSALYMVEDAERKGLLQPGGTIVEATSGNQGIALAMIGKIKGYRVIITVPDRTSEEKVAILKAYGAEVYVCPNTAHHDDPRGYVARAKAITAQIPGAFMPDQYVNPVNADAYYGTLGPEIWEQTKGTVTHFIAGAGTCGTISGVGRYLKEKNPNVTIIGVDAATSFFSSKEPKAYNVEGLGIDIISDVFDQRVVDKILTITDDDAFSATRKLAFKQGIMAGISSGAVMHVATEYAKNLTENDVMVLIFADSGRAYLSKVFNQEKIQASIVEKFKGVAPSKKQCC